MGEFTGVNWIAVVVGTVVSFFVGWAWYSPFLFGKKWAEGSGVSLDSASKMPIVAMITQFIALFLLALVVGVTATSDALFTAIISILAAASFVASTGGFVNKSKHAIIIDFSYVVVAGGVMILIQGLL